MEGRRLTAGVGVCLWAFANQVFRAAFQVVSARAVVVRIAFCNRRETLSVEYKEEIIEKYSRATVPI